MAPKTRQAQTKKLGAQEREIELLEAEFPGFHFRMPTAGETFLDSRDGELCIYRSHLKAGLTLPLPPFLVVILRHCHLVPAQFTPNALENLNGVQKFMALWTIEWAVPNIFSMLKIANMQEKGRLFVQPRQPNRMTLSGTPKGVHGWKEKYYFVSSDAPWGIDTVPQDRDLKALQQVEVTAAVEKLHSDMGCAWFDLNVRTGAVKSSIQPRGKEVPSQKTGRHEVPPAAAEEEEEERTEEGEEEEEAALPKKKEKGKAPIRAAKRRKLILPDEESGAETAEEETTGEGEEKATGEDPSASSPSKGSAEESRIDSSSGETGEDEKEERMEYWFDQESKIFSFRSDMKEGLIPQGEAPSLPMHLLHALLSIDDQAYMETLNDMGLATLQSRLAIGSALVARYISDGSMGRLKGLKECREMGAAQKAKIAELEEKAEKDRELFTNQKNSLLIESRQMAEESCAWQKKYEDSIKEREAEEEKRLVEGQEWEKKMALQEEKYQKRLEEHHAEINRLKEEMEKQKSAASVPSSSLSAEEAGLIYKKSGDFRAEMRKFGDMGFQLLKAALVKDGKMEQEDLDVYNYVRLMARVMRDDQRKFNVRALWSANVHVLKMRNKGALSSPLTCIVSALQGVDVEVDVPVTAAPSIEMSEDIDP